MKHEDIVEFLDPVTGSLNLSDKSKLENNSTTKANLNATTVQKDTELQVSEKELNQDSHKEPHDKIEIRSPVNPAISPEKETPLDEDERVDHELSEIGYFEWLLSPVRFSPRIDILKKGQDEINKYLDLLVIVKKIREIETLEACLMKTDERILFDHVQQPSLSIDADKSKKDRKQREVKVTDWLNIAGASALTEEIELSYDNVKNADRKTRFSERLLDLYEQDKREKNPPDSSGLLEVPKDQILDKLM